MGLIFFFGGGVLEVLAKLQKNMEAKSSDPCPLPGLSPDLAHGSELFSIVVLHVFHVKMLSSQYLSN